MSDIESIGEIVSKIADDSGVVLESILTLRRRIEQSSNLAHYIGQGSNQQESRQVIAFLNSAQLMLAQAILALQTAEAAASTWISSHVMGVRSGTTGGTATGNRNELYSGTVVAGPTSSSGSEHSPFDALSAYMSSQHYGKESFPPSYCNDPVWRTLHRAAFPNFVLPPIEKEVAFQLLWKYMTEHNYSQRHSDIYSQDPVWQELNKYAFPSNPPLGSRLDPNLSSKEYVSISSLLEGSGVEYRPLDHFGHYRSSEDIVDELGGRDKTQGSCSSLAFAYIGNRAGFDVLDFRDGESRSFFSLNDSIQMIANLPGVNAEIEYGTDDMLATGKLLERVEEGKEYYLATGQHAAIVRKKNGAFEYLDLQRREKNGWYLLKDSTLAHRFGCSRTRNHECPNFLIDADSLMNNGEFLSLLGYLNTAESEQVKGGFGHVR